MGNEDEHQNLLNISQKIAQMEQQHPENSNDTAANTNYRFAIKLQAECRDRRFHQLKKIDESGPGELEKFIRNYCQTTFDALSCWNATPAGETAFVACPSYVTGFDPKRFAHRQCFSNATWYRNPETGYKMGNYTSCIDLEDLKFREFVNTLYISGYSISLLALLVSLTIFVLFRSLRCTRIAIHIHLFLSLALNNSMWLLWYWKVIENPSVIINNETFCQVLHIVLQYLMISNYMWMFCEGLHLHLALVVVFVRDGYAMKWFYVIGWVLPFVITILYTLVRISHPRDVVQCWINDSYARWILVVPVLVSILISLLFLINIMRILLTKLHSNSTNPAPIGIKKAVRAALILIPLFGLHYILIPLRPQEKTTAEAIYEIFSALVVSLQGLCVSILFCFANVDVHIALKLSYKKLQRTGTHVTHVTATTQPQQSIGRDTV